MLNLFVWFRKPRVNCFDLSKLKCDEDCWVVWYYFIRQYSNSILITKQWNNGQHRSILAAILNIKYTSLRTYSTMVQKRVIKVTNKKFLWLRNLYFYSYNGQLWFIKNWVQLLEKKIVKISIFLLSLDMECKRWPSFKLPWIHLT